MTATTSRPEERYAVDFPIYLSWQDRRGTVRSSSGRCIDLSASGARIETKDSLESRTLVVLQSTRFGRMGSASIRYCRREGMKYSVGLQFSVAFGLGDAVRRKALNAVLAKNAAN